MCHIQSSHVLENPPEIPCASYGIFCFTSENYTSFLRSALAFLSILHTGAKSTFYLTLAFFLRLHFTLYVSISCVSSKRTQCSSDLSQGASSTGYSPSSMFNKYFWKNGHSIEKCFFSSGNLPILTSIGLDPRCHQYLPWALLHVLQLYDSRGDHSLFIVP